MYPVCNHLPCADRGTNESLLLLLLILSRLLILSLLLLQVSELKAVQEEAEIERQKLLNDALTAKLSKVKRDQESPGENLYSLS